MSWHIIYKLRRITGSENLQMSLYDLGLDAKNPVFRFANNKSADKPAHPRRLISTFVIRFLESVIHVSKHVTSKISTFSLVSAPEETGLSLVGKPEDRF